MFERKEIIYLEKSIFISLLSIAITVVINYQIAKQYLRSYGKTRADFGLIEWLQFGYQNYVVVLAIISLILAILGTKGQSNKIIKISAVLLSIFAGTIVFLRIWRLFV